MECGVLILTGAAFWQMGKTGETVAGGSSPGQFVTEAGA